MDIKKRVLLGMSGGVDSSVAAILLQQEGYEVVGATMKLHNCSDDNKLIEDARRVCEYLGIEHHIFDFREEFQKYVIDDFICEYKKCRTPNPCIKCNKFLKFGTMYEKALKLGCEYIATGHYAKIEFDEKYNKYVLKKSNAGKKDQSYVLYNLPSDLVEKVKLPLAEFHDKSEIRAIAAKHNLPVASKADSEDICFIPDGDYKKFLEENSDLKSKEGNIVDKTGKIYGKHTGLYKYTIGQRKGLGIAHKVPLFVIGFDYHRNELIVGEENELYTKEFDVDDINLILPEKIENMTNVDVKIRYSASAMSARVIKIDNYAKVIFDEPQRAVTPGQSAVFYIDDVVIGGGIIK